MLYKVVLTFESVNEILKRDQLNESYWAVLSCGAVYYTVQGSSNFWLCEWNPEVGPFTGLEIATDTVANATNIFSLATKNSGLVAKVATRF